MIFITYTIRVKYIIMTMDSYTDLSKYTLTNIDSYIEENTWIRPAMSSPSPESSRISSNT